MPGSFVRRSERASADVGTRPGLHEQILVSTGLADLDKVMGGGVPLEALILILEDAGSRQHFNILKYFLAEGLACKQSICWLAAHMPKEGPAHALPQIMEEKGREDVKVEKDKAGEGLRIAWQYKRYLKEGQQQPKDQTLTAQATTNPPRQPPSSSSFRRSGSGSSPARGVTWNWSHTFDLTKPLGEQQLQQSNTVCEEVNSPESALKTVQQFVKALEAEQDRQVKPGALQVGRIAIQSLGGLGWMPESSEEDKTVRMLHFIFALKGLVRRKRCCAFVTCPVGLFSPSFSSRLQHLCDGVLALESLAEDSEMLKFVADPSSCCSLLQVKRIPRLGSLVGVRTEASLFVIRHKRKRIAISVVDVDPEAELAEEEASGSLRKTVASALCSGPPGKPSQLDF